MQFSVLSYHESWLKSISYGSFKKDFCNLLHFSSPESDIISYRLTLPPGSFAAIADWKGVAFRRCWQIPPPLFMQKSALKGGVLNFKATPHNSARNLSERFCASSKFRKRGNTVCIFRFWNCRTGAKDPLRSADVIVRCCLNFFQPFPSLLHHNCGGYVISA